MFLFRSTIAIRQRPCSCQYRLWSKNLPPPSCTFPKHPNILWETMMFCLLLQKEVTPRWSEWFQVCQTRLRWSQSKCRCYADNRHFLHETRSCLVSLFSTRPCVYQRLLFLPTLPIQIDPRLSLSLRAVQVCVGPVSFVPLELLFLIRCPPILCADQPCNHLCPPGFQQFPL